jgi:heme-degrading monooxygenase HmoA
MRPAYPHASSDELGRFGEKEAELAVSYTMGFWTAKDGEEDALIAAWTEFAEWIEQQPGVHEVRLVRDLKEPRKFISFADWDDIESIHAWKSTPEFRERIGRVKQHTDAFVAGEAELSVRRGAAAPVT